ncbi:MULTISPECIES: hypothetical protein [unclassified Isoptericola]|uniref:hypothetical protein n=1 Tax=unclassified Isoptericola TaxID=2623355 RepID=UPI00364BE678
MDVTASKAAGSQGRSSTKVGTALRRLGLDDEAVCVFETLLDRAPVPLSQVEASSGLGPQAFGRAYDRLVESGLAVAATADTLVAPMPPEAAVEAMSRRRTAEIEESRVTIAAAFETFRRERYSAPAGEAVEIVTGPAIGHRLVQEWSSARTSVRQLDSPPYFALEDGVDTALETLARGVRHRMVYARESLTFPGKLADDIERCIAAGEQARVVTAAPVKLIVVDDRVALVSPAAGEADVYNTMLVVHAGVLLTACTALFEAVWATALPFHDRSAGSPRLLHQDRRLLSLLAGGLTDDEVAADLGVSRRTLYRRLEVLSARVGATTRFQLALQAQRRGWL